MLLTFSLTACLQKDISSTDIQQEDPISICTDCSIGDEHNYTYTGSLDIRSSSVRSYENITIDWSNLSQSIQGQDIDASTVTEALLLVFPRLTKTEVMNAFATDRLEQSDIGLYMRCISSDARCMLDDFGLLGSYPGLSSYFTAEEGTWLIVLQNETTLGAVSLLFLDPTVEGDTTAFFSNESASLFSQVDLSSNEALFIPAQSPWKANWTNLSTTGQGNIFHPHRINRLELGLYTESIEILEERFFDLPYLSSERQSFDVEGVDEIELPALENEGNWLLVLWCDACNNPVPPFVGRVHVEDNAQ